MKNKVTKRMQVAIDKFGVDKCVEAYNIHTNEGEGANNTFWLVVGMINNYSHAQATLWGDRMIDAGRVLINQ